MSDFSIEHTIGEFQVRNMASGLVNVGQSWQQNMQHGAEGHEVQGSTRGYHADDETAVARESESEDDPVLGGDVQYPANLNELIATVVWLQHRVADLESQLQSKDLNAVQYPERVEFHVGKLYVRDLSGTLNIGVTSIGDGTGIQPMPSFTMPNDDEAEWRRLEEEGDQDWSTDIGHGDG